MPAFAGSLDTNVLLRLLLNDLPKQHNAVLELFNSNAGQFAVADAAIIEIVFVLHAHYSYTRHQIFEIIKDLIALPKINCNQILFEQALLIFVKHPKLSFEDCCLATYAKLNNANPLFTFDKKLATQSKNTQFVDH